TALPPVGASLTPGRARWTAAPPGGDYPPGRLPQGAPGAAGSPERRGAGAPRRSGRRGGRAPRPVVAGGRLPLAAQEAVDGHVGAVGAEVLPPQHALEREPEALGHGAAPDVVDLGQDF